jgi:hypothetical protein
MVQSCNSRTIRQTEEINSIGKVSELANAKTGDVCIGILQMPAIGSVKLLGWCCRTGVCHRYQGHSEPIAPFTTVTENLGGMMVATLAGGSKDTDD